MDFLNKKPWHPGSYRNRKKVWTAEQEEKERVKKVEQRHEEYKAEQKERIAGDGKESVKFLYQKPPGLEKPGTQEADLKTSDKPAVRVPRAERGFVNHVIDGVKALPSQASFTEHEFVVNQFRNEEEEQKAYELAMMSESERVQMRKRDKHRKEKRKLKLARKLLKRAGVCEDLL